MFTCPLMQNHLFRKCGFTLPSDSSWMQVMAQITAGCTAKPVHLLNKVTLHLFIPLSKAVIAELLSSLCSELTSKTISN